MAQGTIKKLIADFKNAVNVVDPLILIDQEGGRVSRIKENMIENMQAGSVIYDLAAIQGGNTAFTEVDKIVENNGVRIMGESNILNKLPISASNLYAKNMFNFISNLFDKEKKIFKINLDDEIVEKTKIK